MRYNFAAHIWTVNNTDPMLRAVVLTIPACDRWTDRHTDRQDGIAIATTALAMQALRRAVKITPTFNILHFTDTLCILNEYAIQKKTHQTAHDNIKLEVSIHRASPVWFIHWLAIHRASPVPIYTIWLYTGLDRTYYSFVFL